MSGRYRTCQLLISGRVQGVFYRAKTKEKADQLGLLGWVRNRFDGRVEVFVSGPSAQVDALITWCKKGPPLANVQAITVADMDPDPRLSAFQIMRSES